MTPPIKLPPQIEKASAEYKVTRDQVLSIRNTTWFKVIWDWAKTQEEKANHELRFAPINTEDDKKNLFVVRGEYNMIESFITLLNNFQLSKEKEIERDKK